LFCWYARLLALRVMVLVEAAAPAAIEAGAKVAVTPGAVRWPTN